MSSNIAASIRAKLLNVAKYEKIIFQDLLHRYGAEQFLARLSSSEFLERFIFKGGSLLAYLVDTERQTKDLDFSIRQISNKVEDTLATIRCILEMPMEDGLKWDSPEATPLNHPEMDCPGVRVRCVFRLGTAQGLLRMDLAIGDLVEARKIPLQRIRYRGQPLIGPDFVILAYPAETIFSEKLQIAIKRGIQNTRMKDYYDLFKLTQLESLDLAAVRRNVETTFSRRETPVITAIDFTSETIERLQVYWSGFIRKAKITDAPAKIEEVIKKVNQTLTRVYQK